MGGAGRLSVLSGIDPFEVFGWVAAALTLAAFSMRTMMPLRLSALGASVFFIAYGTLTQTFPVLILHLVLFPFNLYRLIQLVRADRAVAAAREGDFSLDWIRTVMRPVKFSDGEVVFRKGDRPHYIYYLDRGRVRLMEIDATLPEGSLFGEIAFFTDAHERTLTAVCDGPCQIMVIHERDFMRLYHQNPAFSLYILRLVATRLLEGVEANANAYRQISATARTRRDPETVADPAHGTR